MEEENMEEKKNRLNDDMLEEIIGGIAPASAPPIILESMADQLAVALADNDVDLEEGISKVRLVLEKKRPSFAKDKIDKLAGLIKDIFKFVLVDSGAHKVCETKEPPAHYVMIGKRCCFGLAFRCHDKDTAALLAL